MRSSLGTAASVRRPDVTLQVANPPSAGRSLRYDILGVAIQVRSDLGEALELVDATYAMFRVGDAPADPGAPPPLTFDLVDPGLGGPCLLETPDGRTRHLADPATATIALLEAIVGAIVAGLHRQGLYAVHAGAVAGPTGAILIAGRSGQGKSTLVLGLVRRGFELLSDELALLDRDGLVHPYPRAVHVRPTTIGLIPELAALEARPRHVLGGGSEWSVGPGEVARMLGSRLGTAAPLAGVVLLDGTPDATGIPRIRDEVPAVAALELLRSIWATSADFAGTLETVAGSLAGVPCVRLAVGRFDATIEALTDRLATGLAETRRDPRATALLGLYRSYGRTGRRVWLETQGTSMHPLVGPGGRMLVEFGATPARVGEVVLFERRETIVAHRVVGRRRRDGREQLIVKGDAEAYFDPPIVREDVLGVVRGIRRSDAGPVRRRGLGGRSSRVIARVSRWTGRGARVAHRVAMHTPDPVRGMALRAIPPLARVPTRLIVAPLTKDPGAEGR